MGNSKWLGHLEIPVFLWDVLVKVSHWSGQGLIFVQKNKDYF